MTATTTLADPAGPSASTPSPVPEPAVGRARASSWTDVLLLALFVGFSGFALTVLAMGALAAAAYGNSGLHDLLHEWGLRPDVPGRIALRMADASHNGESGGQLVLDFGFSALNFGLAVFLYWLRPRDRTARLLAFGLVGTAAVFNLQSHLVYETLDPTLFESITHDGFHIVAALSYLFALLVFPDGRYVPRWRPLPLAALYLTTIPAAALFGSRSQGGDRTTVLVTMFGVLTPAVGVLAQAYRYTRPQDPVERQQSRLLFWALAPAVLVSIFALWRANNVGLAQFEGRELLVLPVTLFRVFQPVFFFIPLALLIGIFRFRLWDVDRVISRTLVYSLLAGFVSAVYVALVVGVGGLIGQRQEGNIWLSIVATFLVAISFDRVRERVQRFANRLVYGKRATPYEVLSAFSERVAESVPTEELLQRMAQILCEGTGALRADVWLKVGDELRRTAVWTSTAGPAPEVDAIPAGLALPPIPDVTTAVAVRFEGDLFGALAVRKPGVEALTPTEAKLLDDLAKQASLVLRNMRLTAELLDRLEELRASRQRLVSAQNDERRRLESNLHDGAQQHLVALKVHVTLAEDLADELGEDAAELLEVLATLKTQAGEALEQFRDLGRGLYPPLLAAEGLGVAVSSHARKLGMPVEVAAEGLGRYTQEVEANVYFCCLEALQNITKYAGASQVRIRLTEQADELQLDITDDGCGFDAETVCRGAGTQNMSDRFEALDGSLRIESSPGAGTTISGRLPVAGRHAGDLALL